MARAPLVLLYVYDLTSPYQFGTAAIHFCVDGYYIDGSTIRHCGGHGSSVHGNWDGIPATCLGKIQLAVYIFIKFNNHYLSTQFLLYTCMLSC